MTRAVRVERPGALKLDEVPAPQPGPGDVVVSVAYAGICGSDVELFNGRRAIEFVRYPVIPGHEWSGTVTAAGDLVDAELLGRKVVGEGFLSCRSCGPCGRSEAILCENRYDEIGFTRPGAWASFLVIPAQQIHVLDGDADLRSAAALEPAACAADAVSRAAVRGGDRVAVVGGGTIGALAVQFLRLAEPSELIVIEPNQDAALRARRSGAAETVEPGRIAQLAGRFDVVIEAAGVPSSPRSCLDLVRRGGRVVLVGIPDPSTALSVADLVTKRTEVHTVFGAPSAAWDIAVDAFTAGIIDPGLLVTHEFDLSRVDEALQLVANSSSAGKVLLRP
jgi:2-desacetyl-2-hydroxyethyl bacteriochlorophyllide A dehydrogenase